MKITHLALAGLCSLALACGGNGEGGSASDADVPDVDVPTVEEAEAQAEEQITEDNADAEFEKLSKEIESDG